MLAAQYWQNIVITTCCHANVDVVVANSYLPYAQWTLKIITLLEGFYWSSKDGTLLGTARWRDMRCLRVAPGVSVSDKRKIVLMSLV